MIKVLIADDHPIVRRGLKQIIVEESDMIVAGEARSDAEALELAWRHAVDGETATLVTGSLFLVGDVLEALLP